MSGDYSRVRFDPRQDFLGVFMQQGRLQLDADWNDLVAQIARRVQAGTLDAVGETVVPRETPHGFEINASAGALEIGRGRIYVDGILAENHGGPSSAEWDAQLAEVFGSPAVDYTMQPYRPDRPPLPQSAGPHLA